MNRVQLKHKSLAYAAILFLALFPLLVSAAGARERHVARLDDRSTGRSSSHVYPPQIDVGLRSPSTQAWSSRREVALHCVKRLGAPLGAGKDEGALERSQQHRRLLVRYRRRIVGMGQAQRVTRFI